MFRRSSGARARAAAHGLAATFCFWFWFASPAASKHYAAMAPFVMHEAFYNPASFWLPYLQSLPAAFEQNPQSYGEEDSKLASVRRGAMLTVL